MTRGEWIKRFKDYMRPYVNDAPTAEDLELYLDTEAEAAYNHVGDYKGTTPEEAADNTVYAIKVSG